MSTNFNDVHSVPFFRSVYSVYFPNQMHNVHYTQILKAYLRHVSVQVCHFQGEQSARFKNQLPMIAVSYKV